MTKTQHPGGHAHFHPFAESERCLASPEFETEPKVKGIKKITTITLSAASMLVSDSCLSLPHQYYTCATVNRDGEKGKMSDSSATSSSACLIPNVILRLFLHVKID